MSLKKLLASRRTGPSLLTGSDIPEGTKSITIEIAAIREAPNRFSAPLIIELKKPIYERSEWAVNITNAQALGNLLGDEETAWVGKKVKLDLISVRNPQSGKIVPSLAVSPRQ